MDKDGSGQLDYQELLDAMKKTGIQVNEQEYYNFFKNLQTDKDERNPNKMKINYTEFLSAAVNLKTYLNKEKLWSLFKYFDVNNKGFITIEEIREVIAREGRKLPDEDL